MSVNLKKYITKRGKDVPYLYQDDKGNFWARKRVGDSTPRISLQTNVESIAIAKVHDAVLQLEQKKFNPPKSDSVVLIKDLYKMVYDQKISNEIKKLTLDRLEQIWTYSLEPFWGNLTTNEINKDLELKFMDWHRRARPGIQFVNVFKYLNNILRFAVEYGYILPKDKPVFKVPRNEQKKLQEQKGTFITHEEFVKIEAQINDHYKLLLNLAYELGMRQMELGALRCDQIIKKDDMLYIDLSAHDTKTGLPRIIPIPKKYHDGILELKRKNQAYIFQGRYDKENHVSAKHIFQVWKSAKRKAGIKRRIRFHDLRHTRATIFVKNNINPMLIAAFLGMSIKTLQKNYLKLKPEDLLILLQDNINLSSDEVTNND